LKNIILALLLVAAIGVDRACAREWSDKSGRHKTDAEFISFKNGKVYLEKEDGNIVSVPIEILSASDLKFLSGKPDVAKYFDSHPELAPRGSKNSAFLTQDFVKIETPSGVNSGEVRRFADMGWAVKSLAFSGNGGILAAGKQDKTLFLFGVNASQTLVEMDDLDALGQLTCCKFTPDNSKLIVGGYTGRIIVWNVDSSGRLEQASQFVGHNGEIKTISISRDGKRVVSGGSDKTLKYWNLETGEEIHSFPVFDGAVRASFITPSGKQALGSDGAALVLFDLEEGEAIQAMDLISTAAHDVAISPDGRKVAVSNHYEIRVWDTKSGEGFLLQDREIQWSIQFSPDAKKILSGARAKVNVWDLSKKSRVNVFDTGSYAYVQTLACSPDNQHVAAIGSSAGQDLQVFRFAGSSK